MTKFAVSTPNLAKDQTKPTKAFCDVTVAGAVVLKGIRIMEGKKGFYLSMSAQKRMRDGKEVLQDNPVSGKKEPVYDDHYFPTSKEVRDELTSAVLHAYNAKLESEKALANTADKK